MNTMRRLKYDHWQAIAFPGVFDIAWRDQLELKSEICFFLVNRSTCFLIL